MMRAVVVFESMFGNTERVARAIAEGLSSHAAVEVMNVDNAPDDLTGFDLIVAGGPTHVHGLSWPSTRKAASEQSAEEIRSRETGLREWLGSLRGSKGAASAAFDTRLGKPRWLTGSAAKGAARLLRRHGCRVVTAPASFLVDVNNVLEQGELDRARDWGAALATTAAGDHHEQERS